MTAQEAIEWADRVFIDTPMGPGVYRRQHLAVAAALIQAQVEELKAVAARFCEIRDSTQDEAAQMKQTLHMLFELANERRSALAELEGKSAPLGSGEREHPDLINP